MLIGYSLRPSRGVREVRLHPIIDLLLIEQSHHKPMGMLLQSYRFVMGLQQWYKVYKLGEDQLHGPPVVALIASQVSILWKAVGHVENDIILYRSKLASNKSYFYIEC